MILFGETAVKRNGGVSRAFCLKVDVYQGSVLSPLLFIIVQKALSKKVTGGLPLELLYADDPVLAADTKELLLENINKWKAAMEEKAEYGKDISFVLFFNGVGEVESMG